ncbi:MAG: hypothetical protein U0S12_12735 [Fimbriimonadales bacterium]
MFDLNVEAAIGQGDVSTALELILSMGGEPFAEHAILAVELLALRGRASHAIELIQRHGLAKRLPSGLFASIGKLCEAFGASPPSAPDRWESAGYAAPPRLRDLERIVERSTRDGVAAIAKAVEAEGFSGTYDADLALTRGYRRDRDWPQVTRLLNAHRDAKWHSPVFWLFSADSAAAAGMQDLARVFVHEALAIEPGWSQPKELLQWMTDNPPGRRAE